MPLMAKPRIVIMVNSRKPAVAEQVRGLSPWLQERAMVVAQVDVAGVERALEESAQLCIVFGGDGTLLAAARRVAAAGIPIMGVNMGKLGFLADFSVEELRQHLDGILAGKVPATERIMLHVRAGDGIAFESLAANDVVIAAGAPFRAIDLHVAHAGGEIATYMGDGLIVATATGSTGHTLSAAGPILEPTLEATVITPIAPHSLSLRPIVVRADTTVSVTATRINPGTTLVIDGQISHPLREGETVRIGSAPHRAKVIPNPNRTFFQKLVAKLQWGQSPHHLD
jgi:NAD+ kinase